MDGLQWKTLLKFMIWGYPCFWKHPYTYTQNIFQTSLPQTMSIIQGASLLRGSKPQKFSMNKIVEREGGHGLYHQMFNYLEPK